ncbi:hypothetical protein GBA52_002419 [Prunus armeniaca]|nr:hypothetical protein GBA52_002419 [Prunus armeniaca]
MASTMNELIIPRKMYIPANDIILVIQTEIQKPHLCRSRSNAGQNHGFVKSECAEYRHKFGHFGRDRPDLLANIVRESKIEALQAKVFDIESKITHIDGFSDKLDCMLRSFHDK